MLQLNVSLFNRKHISFKEFCLSAEVPPVEAIGEHLSFTGPVSVKLNAHGSGSSISLEGTVSGKLNLRCGRCLELYEYSFAVPFYEIYDREMQDNTGEKILFSGDVIDILPEVMKTIILALPMKTVCREDCLGLCSSCGCNLNNGQCQCVADNVDPRLSVLKDLFKK